MHLKLINLNDPYMYNSIEICAGAGGQALGLGMAGFSHVALVEYEKDYCECLKRNRQEWNIFCKDVHHFDGKPYYGQIDLLAGGVPCPPFSVAGKQLGADDERDLFPQMLRLVQEINPRIVMIENVRGILSSKFNAYREQVLQTLKKLGYSTHLQLLNASDYGVPQLRPRVIIIGIRRDLTDVFMFPEKIPEKTLSVGETLYDLMSANGWKAVEEWRRTANKIAPTLVGGSKKHGGPDLGPTRARKAWAELSERAAAVHSGVVDPSVDNMLKITSDGRKLGLDQRLMNPLLPDDPNSKLNACVRNVLRIYEEGKSDKLTQLLFCDLSTPKNDGTFNVYEDIRAKLIQSGVPEEEIAFIHDADTEAKKKDLFAKVRTGQVRVLLGSTQKMGAGTNVQDRLVAMHHLDVGWRPADMTQRNGRIIRQGNRNKEVQVYQYVTEGTFDAYLYVRHEVA